MKKKYVMICLGAVLSAGVLLYLVKKKEKGMNPSELVKLENESVPEVIPAEYKETEDLSQMKEVQTEKPEETTEETVTMESENQENKSVIKAAPGSRRIGQYDDDMNLIAEYDSATLAAKAIGSNRTSIRDCANGKQKHAAGYIWRYLDE